MKRFIFFLFIFNIFFSFSQETVMPFLENIVTQFPNVRDIAISPDGNEAMLSAQSAMGNTSAIITFTKKNNIWSNAKIASFSGQFFDIEPFFLTTG